MATSSVRDILSRFLDALAVREERVLQECLHRLDDPATPSVPLSNARFARVMRTFKQHALPGREDDVETLFTHLVAQDADRLPQALLELARAVHDEWLESVIQEGIAESSDGHSGQAATASVPEPLARRALPSVPSSGTVSDPTVIRFGHRISLRQASLSSGCLALEHSIVEHSGDDDMEEDGLSLDEADLSGLDVDLDDTGTVLSSSAAATDRSVSSTMTGGIGRSSPVHGRAFSTALSLEGRAVGERGELFELVNPQARKDKAPVRVGQLVALQSMASGRYLGLDPLSEEPRARREAIGESERWLFRTGHASVATRAPQRLRRRHRDQDAEDLMAELDDQVASAVGTTTTEFPPADTFVRAGEPCLLLAKAAPVFLTAHPSDGSLRMRPLNSVTAPPQPPPDPPKPMAWASGLTSSEPPELRAVVTAGGVRLEARLDRSDTSPFRPSQARWSPVPMAAQWVLVRAHGPGAAAGLHLRPNLSGNNILLDALRATTDDNDARKPLGTLPPPLQESLLVQDVLDACLGITGRYIVPHVSASRSNPREEAYAALFGAHWRDFDLSIDPIANDPAPHGSIVGMAQRLLPLLRTRLRVGWAVEQMRRPEAGLVANAISAAAAELLQEFHLLVTQVESMSQQSENRPMTLSQLWLYLQPAQRTIFALHDALDSCRSSWGGALLDTLHRRSLRVGDASQRELCEFLLERGTAPFLRQLEMWIFRGVLEDEHGEFLVRQRRDLRRESLAEDFNSTYWEERFSLRHSQCPAFLKPFAEQILSTGKYLYALRNTDPEEDEDAQRSLGRRRMKTRTVLSPHAHRITFSPEPRAYEPLIRRAYSFAAHALLRMLVEAPAFRLLDRFTALRGFFLLKAGDFLAHFMEAAEDELGKSAEPSVGLGLSALGRSTATEARPDMDAGKNVASLQRLQSLLELSLRTSVASRDPFLEDVTCQLSSTPLVDQLSAIHHLNGTTTDAPSVEASRRSRGKKDVRGYDAFTLDYNTSWPLSIVLPRRAITKYQLLFRHLFYVRHVERRLSLSWTSHQACKELDLGPELAHSNALRHRMLHFIQNLLHYMTFEVVEPRWHEMATDLRAALRRADAEGTLPATVDDVARRHMQFLDTCLEECLLTNHDLLKPLTRLVTLCLLFANNMISEMARHTPSESDVEREAASLREPGSTRSQGGDRGRRRGDKSAHENLARKTRMRLQAASMRHTMAQHDWQRTIHKSSNMFDKFLRQFLAQLVHRSASEYKSHLVHLCTRLDFNGFYSEHLRLPIAAQPDT